MKFVVISVCSIICIGVIIAICCLRKRIKVAWISLLFWFLVIAATLLVLYTDYNIMTTIINCLAGLLFLSFIVLVNTRKGGKRK